jgi:hypothetical protein
MLDQQETGVLAYSALTSDIALDISCSERFTTSFASGVNYVF